MAKFYNLYWRGDPNGNGRAETQVGYNSLTEARAMAEGVNELEHLGVIEIPDPVVTQPKPRFVPNP